MELDKNKIKMDKKWSDKNNKEKQRSSNFNMLIEFN